MVAFELAVPSLPFLRDFNHAFGFAGLPACQLSSFPGRCLPARLMPASSLLCRCLPAGGPRRPLVALFQSLPHGSIRVGGPLFAVPPRLHPCLRPPLPLLRGPFSELALASAPKLGSGWPDRTPPLPPLPRRLWPWPAAIAIAPSSPILAPCLAS